MPIMLCVQTSSPHVFNTINRYAYAHTYKTAYLEACAQDLYCLYGSLCPCLYYCPYRRLPHSYITTYKGPAAHAYNTLEASMYTCNTAYMDDTAHVYNTANTDASVRACNTAYVDAFFHSFVTAYMDSSIYASKKPKWRSLYNFIILPIWTIWTILPIHIMLLLTTHLPMRIILSISTLVSMPILLRIWTPISLGTILLI
jgi:hypothetical protein